MRPVPTTCSTSGTSTSSSTRRSTATGWSPAWWPTRCCCRPRAGCRSSRSRSGWRSSAASAASTTCTPRWSRTSSTPGARSASTSSSRATTGGAPPRGSSSSATSPPSAWRSATSRTRCTPRAPRCAVHWRLSRPPRRPGPEPPGERRDRRTGAAAAPAGADVPLDQPVARARSAPAARAPRPAGPAPAAAAPAGAAGRLAHRAGARRRRGRGHGPGRAHLRRRLHRLPRLRRPGAAAARDDRHRLRRRRPHGRAERVGHRPALRHHDGRPGARRGRGRPGGRQPHDDPRPAGRRRAGPPRPGTEPAVRGRLARLLGRRATAAVLGQGTQALAGLALQVAAARLLGAGGLAVFALAYGALVLGTAVCSGLVGDSLTVLDRADRGNRAGLHVWTALVATAVGLAGAAAALVSGLVPVWAGLLLGPACAAFVVEDTLRRLLMATGRYRALPAVDLTSLAGALAALGVAGLTGGITLASFVVALLVGRVFAAFVAWWRVPAGERPRGPWRRPDLRGVAAFGTWRAAAPTVRPGSLTLLRVLVVAAAGAAAYGPLEAARVYTAPTLTLVAGIGSFLLPHFVGLRARPIADSLG